MVIKLYHLQSENAISLVFIVFIFLIHKRVWIQDPLLQGACFTKIGFDHFNYIAPYVILSIDDRTGGQ